MKIITRENAIATQTQHPWRSTVRTGIQVVTGLAAAAPLVYTAITLQEPSQALGAAGVALATSAAITRVMALPIVEQTLRKIGLGASPSEPEAVPNTQFLESAQDHEN